jgi:hypothetical protein
MIAKIFWPLVTLDALAALVLWKVVEGPTHGLIILGYTIILTVIVITACLFPVFRSDGWRMAALICLLVSSAPVLFSSVSVVISTYQRQARSSGTAFFDGPALALAQAVVRQDAELVKQLIPTAGDLNQPQGRGLSIWQFSVMETRETDCSIDVLRALIAAGADPKRDTSADSLSHALAIGPQLTRFLLEAGLSPNVLDHERRPVWWETIVQGEDEESTARLRMMLEHGADLNLRAPDGQGPIGKAAAGRNWYAVCLIIEASADWKKENLSGPPLPDRLESEIIRRNEYPLPVPEKLTKVLALLKGKPVVLPAPRSRTASDISVPDILHQASLDKLDATRANVALLSQQPDWVRRVTAFYDEGDTMRRNQVALLLSLKPDALPENAQELCWQILREQVAWYDQSAASLPNERKGWLLKETAVIAVGVASIPGTVRDRHRAEFTGLRDRIEKCRREKDPDAASLPDLNQADWMTARH